MDDITRICDACLPRFAAFETSLNQASNLNGAHGEQEAISALSHGLAEDLLGVVPGNEGAAAATEILHRHPLHSHIILQSAIIRQALLKPRGYAGDMELMLMLCDGLPRGSTPFAQAVNDVFVQLPCAQAVRDRVSMLGRLLLQLPDGARVLNLACGPALEIQGLVGEQPERHLQIDLVDHDPLTLAYLQAHLTAAGIRVFRGNAFHMMSGDLTVMRQSTGAAIPLTPGYDLVYSAGLYDYLPDPADGVGGAPELTRVLFSLLNPGGLLLVGNYLETHPGSGHRPHVRAMMELYSRWYLRYRSPDAIADFASTIDADHTLTLLDENGLLLEGSPQATIGFAAIQSL